MTLTVSSDRIHSTVSWRRVDTGLWVAQRDGGHLGRVDATGPARYDAFGARGTVLGVHPSLRAAQLAVENQA